jgi:hypothetical protein
MARKGVFVTDPQVQRLSRAQWIWEFRALKKRERDENKAFKKTLVSVLGLDVIPPLDKDGNIKADKDLTKEDEDWFMPMILLSANHHLAGPYFKKIKEHLDSKEMGLSDDSKSDEEFERFSKALMTGDVPSDMEPIISEITNVDKNRQIRNTILEQDMRAAGVIPASEVKEKIKMVNYIDFGDDNGQ